MVRHTSDLALRDLGSREGFFSARLLLRVGNFFLDVTVAPCISVDPFDLSPVLNMEAGLMISAQSADWVTRNQHFRRSVRTRCRLRVAGAGVLYKIVRVDQCTLIIGAAWLHVLDTYPELAAGLPGPLATLIRSSQRHYVKVRA